MNPNCPPHLLERLAVDDYWWVRLQVAQHPRTPAPVLAHLVADPVQEVRKSALDHSACPPEYRALSSII